MKYLIFVVFIFSGCTQNYIFAKKDTLKNIETNITNLVGNKIETSGYIYFGYEMSTICDSPEIGKSTSCIQLSYKSTPFEKYSHGKTESQIKEATAQIFYAKIVGKIVPPEYPEDGGIIAVTSWKSFKIIRKNN